MIQTVEKFNDYTTNISNGGTVTHAADTAGNIMYVHPGTVSGNWTLNVTGINLNAGFAAAMTVVIAQGSTAYMPTTFQLSTSTQTVTWQGSGTMPTGNNSKTDVLVYSILCTSTSTYTVLGQLVSFG